MMPSPSGSEPKTPLTWVISDGRGLTGNLNACLGVADALGGKTEIIDLDTIKANGGLKPFLEHKLSMTHSGCKDAPNFVVSSFSRTAQMAARIKELLKGKTEDPVFLVQIRSPAAKFQTFDLIANPSHENPIAGDNVMQITGVPHRINAETLTQGYRHWEDQFSCLQDKKIIAVLLGGNTPSIPDYPGQGGEFTAEEARELGKRVNAIAQAENAHLLATNSPRTSPEAWQAFMSEITVNGYFHDLKIDSANHLKGNPYTGILHAADEIIVTADSTSMLCEAASTGKPLSVACETAANMRDDHKRFVQAFVASGYATPLSGREQDATTASPKPLNTSQEIAAEAMRRYQILKTQQLNPAGS